MSVGTAIFDSALIAYPLYQTSRNLTSPATPEASEELTRLLRFWFVFGGLGVVEEFGISGIPGYYLLKGGLMFSMYSDVHSRLVNDVILSRVCKQYINVSDKVVSWWNQQALPQVNEIDRRSGGWLSVIKNRTFGFLGYGTATAVTPVKTD